MESKILRQEKNPYLKREEYSIEIKSETNPVESEIVSFVGKAAELTTIEKINNNFGSQVFNVEVFVYDDLSAKKEVQTIAKKEKKRIEEEKKKAAEAERKKAEEEAKAAEAARKAEETKEEEVEDGNKE